ncbi:MAG: oligoendopeptidase F [candidate division Zixibacteria bacterium RBG_16_50_21]|nr:MAG: oligoendopeptidase F [candidate division Zixibacteria bacterium RBG_16_50_21]
MALLTCLAFATGFSQSTTGSVPERKDIEDVYQWRLEDIYAADALWETDYKKVETLLPQFGKFKGQLSKSSKELLNCLALRDTLSSILDRLYVYSYMKRDEDNRLPVYQEMSDRAGSLRTRVNQALAFIEPEITAIPEAKLKSFLKYDQGLIIYRHYMEDLFRTKAHILSPQEEEILALAGDLARGPSTVFEMLDNADIKYGIIKDEKGKKVVLSKARYQKFVESTNRRLRKDSNRAFNSAYFNYFNTLGANLSANVARDIFLAKAREYNSSLEASLDVNNVPTSVYHNLVKTVNENLKPLHRYTALRKKVLKLRELYAYDLYVPLVPQAKMEFTYEQAKEVVTNGLSPFGETYIKDMTEGFHSGWIDVYETQGKGSGAYSWGAYTTHPYVLLNFNGTLEDVFTVAHEMGHSMQSLYTNRTQPFVYQDYSTFVAEVASITNEVLLMNELLKETVDPQQRLYLTNYFIEQIRGTFYQQVLFAEFELAIHEKAEKGEALSSESMSKLYRELLEKYWGPELTVDSINTIGWARIPHFYYNYYVFQYATGQAAGVALAEDISKGDVQAKKRYMDFLASGSSDYPIELLKKAGVDMTKPEPILAVIELFDRLVGKMEKLVE